jgi:hypothetical protein
MWRHGRHRSRNTSSGINCIIYILSVWLSPDLPIRAHRMRPSGRSVALIGRTLNIANMAEIKLPGRDPIQTRLGLSILSAIVTFLLDYCDRLVPCMCSVYLKNNIKCILEKFSFIPFSRILDREYPITGDHDGVFLRRPCTARRHERPTKRARGDDGRFHNYDDVSRRTRFFADAPHAGA